MLDFKKTKKQKKPMYIVTRRNAKYMGKVAELLLCSLPHLGELASGEIQGLLGQVTAESTLGKSLEQMLFSFAKG